MTQAPRPLQQIRTINGTMPVEGPIAMPIYLDFSSAGTLDLDFTLTQMQRKITGLQSVIVRNWDNPNPLTITIEGTGEVLDIPANADATLPIVSAYLGKISATTVSGVIIPTIWCNFPLDSVVTYAAGGIVITGTVDVLPAPVTPAGGAAHSIAVGGTAVTVFAAAAGGIRGMIQNPFDATEDLFVDPVNTAQSTSPGTNGTTVRLLPGGIYTIPEGTVTAVTAVAATAGHAFVAIQWS